MDLLRGAGFRVAPDDQAELFSRNLREYITQRREEISTRPHIHRWKPFDACNAELVQLLDDIEKQLDLPGVASGESL